MNVIGEQKKRRPSTAEHLVPGVKDTWRANRRATLIELEEQFNLSYYAIGNIAHESLTVKTL